jgi:hypothetical protein
VGPGGAAPTGEGLAAAGCVGHDRGWPRLGVAGEPPARVERAMHDQGRPGLGAAGEALTRQSRLGVTEAVRGRSRVRHGQGEARVWRRRREAGCGGIARSSWWWRRCASQHVEEMLEREKWEKERAG